MSPKPWLVVGLMLALGAVALAQTDQDLARGVRQVQEGDLEGGIATLDAVVRKLSAAAGRSADLGRAYLHLGIAYVSLDQERAGRASFREALKLDRSLRLDPASTAPRVLRAFEATLQELGPAPSAAPPVTTLAPARSFTPTGTVPPSPASTPVPAASVAPWPLPEGENVLVVAASGGAAFTSIMAAVRSAPAGAQIRVRAGVYAETLLLDKPVEIVGEPQTQVVGSGASAVVVKADGVSLRGLTLRALAGGANDFFGVDVQGRLTLENSDIASDALAAVAVRGSGEAVLKSCRIHDSRSGGGLFVLEDGRATLEESTALGNRYSGVEAKDRATVEVRRSILRDNGGRGFFLQGSARGVLEDSEIQGNSSTGVEVGGSATATIRNCKVHQGKVGGVLIDGGHAVIDGLDVFRHPRTQFEVRNGGEVTLRKSQIHEGAGNGLAVHDQGRGTFEDVEIWGHPSTEVWIYRGGDPLLRRCTVRDSRSAGVFVDQNGRGTLEDCDIFGATLAGVQVATGGSPTLRRCKIHDGLATGLFFSDRGAGVVEDSQVYGNGSAGVEIKTGAAPVLRRTRITRNQYQAIWVGAGASATVEGCDLRGNRGGAWNVEGGALVQQSGNTQ